MQLGLQGGDVGGGGLAGEPFLQGLVESFLAATSAGVLQSGTESGLSSAPFQASLTGGDDGGEMGRYPSSLSHADVADHSCQPISAAEQAFGSEIAVRTR